MKIYVINGPDAVGKTSFAVSLAQYLKDSNKVLLIQGKRSSNSNIEYFFNKDGMISYDLADYFTGLAPLSTVLVNETDNLDFIISPLLEDKYEFSRDDISKFLSDISYDYVVIDGIDKSLISEKFAIDVVGEDSLSFVNNSDAFFINKVSNEYDVREYKSQIESKEAKFLGTVKNGQDFNGVIDNLKNNNSVTVPKIGFFEKLFKK